MKKILSLLLLCSISFVSAQDIRFQKKKVIDSVAISNDSLSESYSIYLPSNFSLEKEWPVIFIFEPNGVGKRGVHFFSEAAEKYGYILVGSNNIKNGKLEPNLQVYNRLSNEIINLFPVNPSRIYTAGFSGGARLASSIGVLSTNIAGVIANSAGFSPSFPPKKPTFDFIGIVGNTDFNYIELINTTSFLKRNKFNTELYIFEGGHEWAPSETIVKAIESIELKLRTEKLGDKSDDFIEEKYKEDYQYVVSLLQNKKPQRAIEELERMQQNYKPVFEVDSLKESSKAIRRNPLFKKAINAEKSARSLEKTIRFNYLEYFKEDLQEIVMDNLGWWDEQSKMIDGYINGPDVARQRMGKRLRGMLFTLGNETLSLFDAKAKNNIERALYLNIFMTLANPKAYDTWKL